jgi:hypothetical protein
MCRLELEDAIETYGDRLKEARGLINSTCVESCAHRQLAYHGHSRVCGAAGSCRASWNCIVPPQPGTLHGFERTGTASVSTGGVVSGPSMRRIRPGVSRAAIDVAASGSPM